MRARAAARGGEAPARRAAMNAFDQRWRELARRAARAEQPPLPDAPSLAAVRRGAGALRRAWSPNPFVLWLGGAALPLAVIAVAWALEAAVARDVAVATRRTSLAWIPGPPLPSLAITPEDRP